MTYPQIERLEDIFALVIPLQGRLDSESFIPVYDYVLSHPFFEKHINLIWNANNARLREIKLQDASLALNHIKSRREDRGDSASAWVFARGEDYTTACMVKAALGGGVSIRYEIFNNLVEAKSWIRDNQSKRPSGRPRPPIV